MGRLEERRTAGRQSGRRHEQTAAWLRAPRPHGGGRLLLLTDAVSVLLHEAVDLEPVGAAAVAAARLGHADGQALPQAAGLARGAIPLVHHTAVGVLAVGYRGLIVAEAAKERLAALAGESPKVEASRLLLAHSTQLVLQGVDRVDLK